MVLELERINDRFNVKEFKDYVGKMITLHEIMINLRNLSNESNQIIFSRKDEGQEYAKYFNDQNIINNRRNVEYIEEMMRYVVKRQKELVDDMHSKLKLDQIEEEEFDISEPPELPELHDPHETSEPPKPPEIPERYKLDENK